MPYARSALLALAASTSLGAFSLALAQDTSTLPGREAFSDLRILPFDLMGDGEPSYEDLGNGTFRVVFEGQEQVSGGFLVAEPLDAGTRVRITYTNPEGEDLVLSTTSFGMAVQAQVTGLAFDGLWYSEDGHYEALELSLDSIQTITEDGFSGFLQGLMLNSQGQDDALTLEFAYQSMALQQKGQPAETADGFSMELTLSEAPPAFVTLLQLVLLGQGPEDYLPLVDVPALLAELSTLDLELNLSSANFSGSHFGAVGPLALNLGWEGIGSALEISGQVQDLSASGPNATLADATLAFSLPILDAAPFLVAASLMEPHGRSQTQPSLNQRAAQLSRAFSAAWRGLGPLSLELQAEGLTLDKPGNRQPLSIDALSLEGAALTATTYGLNLELLDLIDLQGGTDLSAESIQIEQELSGDDSLARALAWLVALHEQNAQQAPDGWPQDMGLWVNLLASTLESFALDGTYVATDTRVYGASDESLLEIGEFSAAYRLGTFETQTLAELGYSMEQVSASLPSEGLSFDLGSAETDYSLSLQDLPRVIRAAAPLLEVWDPENNRPRLREDANLANLAVDTLAVVLEELPSAGFYAALQDLDIQHAAGQGSLGGFEVELGLDAHIPSDVLRIELSALDFSSLVGISGSLDSLLYQISLNPGEDHSLRLANLAELLRPLNPEAEAVATYAPLAAYLAPSDASAYVAIGLEGLELAGLAQVSLPSLVMEADSVWSLGPERVTGNLLALEPLTFSSLFLPSPQTWSALQPLSANLPYETLAVDGFADALEKLALVPRTGSIQDFEAYLTDFLSDETQLLELFGVLLGSQDAFAPNSFLRAGPLEITLTGGMTRNPTQTYALALSGDMDALTNPLAGFTGASLDMTFTFTGLDALEALMLPLLDQPAEAAMAGQVLEALNLVRGIGAPSAEVPEALEIELVLSPEGELLINGLTWIEVMLSAQ